jgi:hypothetical protein
MRSRTRSALGLLGVAAGAAAYAAGQADQQDLRTRLIADAFHFGFPVYEFTRTRAAALRAAESAGRPGLNALVHRTSLTDARARGVTTPNNDTLYSSAWLDLSNGPVELELPPAMDRYVSVALMDAFTDNVAVLRPVFGRRRSVTLVGPGTKLAGKPSDYVRLPTNDAWLLARVVVSGPEDLAKARAVQSEISLKGRSQVAPSPSGVSIPQSPVDPRAFLDVVNETLGRSPLPDAHKSRARRLARAGVRPAQKAAFGTLPHDIQDAWTGMLPNLVAGLKNGLASVGTLSGGWSYPKPGIGQFGADDVYRSRVALGGLGALPADEAVYLTGIADADGTDLSGSHCYRVTIPPVPLRPTGFWSLTMYELTPEGRQYFVANPLNRYALGDRTPQIVRNSDNSVTVFLQRAEPQTESNWLPAPPGRFRVAFRAYLPGERVGKPGFLPPIERIDCRAGRIPGV